MQINRIVIVGLGSIGKRHLRLARELLPSADIRVLRHQECDLIPEFSNGCFSSIDQVIKFEPEIAVIANPAPFHLDVALPLARLKTHLLIEKPISVSTDRIDSLIEICREHGSILLTGYNLRFLRSLQKFRTLVNEKLTGKILSVRCEIGQYLPSWRPDSDYRNSVSARKELGGGVLLELSHEIDYLRWIFGDIEWVQAVLSKQSNLEIDVEDTVLLILGFSPTSDGHKLVGTLSMDFVRRDTTRVCTVIGDNGSLRWDGLTGCIEHFAAGAEGWCTIYKYQHQRDESYLAEWMHFLDCINGKDTPLITGEDGAHVLQIISAAHQSSDSKCIVQI